MVKKGEYFDYAISLFNRMEDFDPLLAEKDQNPEAYYPITELAILLEAVNKIKELEVRIIELEKK